MDMQKVEDTLRGLIRHSGISASVLVSSDGLPITSASNKAIDEELIGAMVAAMMAVGTRSSKEVLHGVLEYSIIHTDNGYMLLFQVTDSILLVITTNPNTKLGMVLLAAKHALSKLVPQFDF